MKQYEDLRAELEGLSINAYLEKARVSAPIGTIHNISGVDYIKTPDGWRYKSHFDAKQKQEKESRTNKQTADPKYTTGSTVTASDGTKGKVVGQAENGNIKLEFTKQGEKKTVEAPSKVLDEKAELEQKTSKEPVKKEESQVSPQAQDKEKGEKEGKVEKEDKSHPDEEVSLLHQARNESDHEDFSDSKYGFEGHKADDEEKEEEVQIKRKFAVLERNTSMLINGGMKSMVVYGSGGVGKTYGITKQLEKEGIKFYDVDKHSPGDRNYNAIKITGEVTAADLYKKMFEHNGKILVFDDCDSVLNNDKNGKSCQNLFKGALDTSGDGTINWGTAHKIKDSDGEEIPSSFKADLKCIFITNKDIKDKKNKEALQPLISRGTGLNLSMSPTSAFTRIKDIAEDKKTGKFTELHFDGIKYTNKDMKEVLQYLYTRKDEKEAEINVRTIGALIQIKQQAEKSGEKDWWGDADLNVLKK